jgi:adenylate cyclase
VSAPVARGSGFRNRVRGIGVRQVRLASGLVLVAYLLSHFVNHALGNISLGAMEAALSYHLAFWRSLPIAVVFLSAGAIHWYLGLQALYERREFRYPAKEIVQLVSGIAIPFLLVMHFVSTRLPQPLFGHAPSYAQAITAYWVTRPYAHWLQYALLVVAWAHACIGLYFWLRLRRWFATAAPWLLAAAVLVPTLALLGLFQSSREVVALSQVPEWRAVHLPQENATTPPQRALLDSIIDDVVLVYAVVLVLIFVARGIRILGERRGGTVTLRYPDGQLIRVPRGTTVLEASLRNRIPHASVCGGKARCSTCRIRVMGDLRKLPPPSRREVHVLERVGVRGDPAVRLACQLRPTHDIRFHFVFPPNVSAAAIRSSARSHMGEERYVVSMFVDMRGSTLLAERRLPFDTMFLINRFVAAVAKAIEEAGGRPNQFVGDGVLALFGLETDAATACRQALNAVRGIGANIERFNTEFAVDLREPIGFGIGINGGDVVIGEVGYRGQTVFTALGDPVNVAARLEQLTKELDCEVVLAQDVGRRAGLEGDGLSVRQIDIRGRREALDVCVVARASQMPVVGLQHARGSNEEISPRSLR